MASQTRYVQTDLTAAWTTSAEILGPPDDTCGSSATNNQVNDFDFVGNPFTIPDASTIDGIELIVEQAADDSDDGSGFQLWSVDSTWTEEKLALNTAGTTCADSAPVTIGTPNDSWLVLAENPWTATWINSSSFIIRLLQAKDGKAGTTFVDSIEVIVYYTEGGTPYTEEPDETLTMSDTQYKSATTRYDENTSVTEFLAKSMTNIFTEITTFFSDSQAYRLLYADMYNAVAIVHYLAKSITSPIYEAIGVNEYLTYVSDWYYSILNTYTLFSDVSPLALIYQSIYQVLTIGQFLEYSSQWYRYPFEPASLTDYMYNAISALIEQSISILNYLTYISTWERFPPEVLTLFSNVDAQVSGALTKIVNETIALVHYLTYESGWYYDVLDTIALSDTNLASFYKYTIDVFNILDFRTMKTGQFRDTSLSVSTYLTRLSIFERYLPEVLTLFSDIDTQVSGFLSQSVLEVVALLHYLTYESSWYRVVPEAVTFIDYLNTSLGDLVQELLEAVDIGHYIRYDSVWKPQLYNTLSVIDSMASGILELVTRFIRLRFIGDDD